MSYADTARDTTAAPRRRFSQGPWAAAPLLVVVAAFVAYSLPPYLTLDPGRSRIAPPPGVAFYYPLLVAHVVFGAVAILASGFQIWPWFRRRWPGWHRRIGRIYVFGGVLPAGVVGLAIGAVTPFGPVLRASDVLLAIVWLGVTVAGLRAARAGAIVEHRRWMIRSVVLTLSVISNRVWAVVWILTLLPQLPTTFGGNEQLLVQTVAGLSGWLGWTLPLLAAEWWLETRRARTALQPAPA